MYLAWVEAIVTDRPTDDGLLFLFNKTLAGQICGSASQELPCLEILVTLTEWKLHAYELYTIILHLSGDETELIADFTTTQSVNTLNDCILLNTVILTP